MALLLHQRFKFLFLFGCQNLPDLLARITPNQLELRPNELPQVTGVLLPLADDFLNLLPLLWRKIQLGIQLLDELFAQYLRAQRSRHLIRFIVRPRRLRSGGAVDRQWTHDMIHEQSAGNNTRAENHDRGQNDIPVFHWAWSPWSMDAKSVVSKF